MIKASRDRHARPASDNDDRDTRRASGCDRHRARRRTRQGAGEGREQRRPAADQPVADQPARHARAPNRCAYFDRKNERAADREVLLRRASMRRNGRRPAN
mgnify:CR=1 FL=1